MDWAEGRVLALRFRKLHHISWRWPIWRPPTLSLFCAHRLVDMVMLITLLFRVEEAFVCVTSDVMPSQSAKYWVYFVVFE